jgi:phage shock protein A
MHWTQEDVPPGREDFIRDNAVAIVEQRDEQIKKLKAVITQLERSRTGMRALIRQLRTDLEACRQRFVKKAKVTA